MANERSFPNGETLAYLRGDKFDEQLCVTLGPLPPVKNRLEVISGLIAGRKVVDIGFVDHLPLVDQKIAANEWFHGRLSSVASRCLGIDINAPGVDYLRRRHHVEDAIAADLTGPEDVTAIRETHWDYFILSEVLEHIDNPVDFLSAIRDRYGSHFEAMIITVPNAFCGGNLVASLRMREVINSDHRFWFTPYTLAKVVTMAGYGIRSMQFANYSRNSPSKRFLKTFVLRYAPVLAERIVLVCEPHSEKRAPV